MAESKVEVLEYEFSLNVKKALGAANTFEKDLSRRLKSVAKAEKDLNGGISEYLHKMGRAKQVVAPILQKEARIRKDMFKLVLKASKASRDQVKEVKKQEAVLIGLEQAKFAAEQKLAELQKKAGSSNEKVDREAISAAKEQLKNIQQEIKEERRIGKEAEDTLDVRKKQLDSLKEQHKLLATPSKEAKVVTKGPDIAALAKGLKETGEDLAKPFKAFAEKKLPEVFQEGGILFSKVVKKMAVLGDMHKASKAGKGEALGGILGAMGKMSASVSGLVKGFTKFLPLIEIASSLILGMIKFLLDAEAAMKDFQREVLATAGSGDFLSSSMGDVEKGAKAANDAMRDAYSATQDFPNISRGVTKEMAVAFRSQMGSEGVSTAMLNKEIAKVPTTVSTLAGGLSSFNDVLWTSVAYSRNWGVSLSELTQLQGELTSEVGMGVASTTAEFERLTQGADEAGMHSNKFFGIVRSFSADLSLFALRMMDVTTAITAMGKVMNPREAQKFLQTLEGIGKTDIQSKLRGVMLAGQAPAQGILKKGVESRVESTTQELNLDAGTMNKLKSYMLKGNTDEVENALIALGDKVSSTQSGAILQLTRDMKRANSGDTAELAAIQSRGPAENLALLQKASEHIFHGQKIEDLSRDQLLAVSQAIGIDVEMVDKIALLHSSLNMTRKELAKKLEDGSALTETETKLLKKLGITTKGAEAAAAVRAKEDQEIYNNMAKDQQDLLTGAGKSKDFAGKTARLTVSTLDQFSQIVESLLGKIFVAIKKIGDSFIFGGQSNEDKRIEDLADHFTSGEANKELAAIWEASGKDSNKYQKDAISKVLAPALAKNMAKSTAEQKTGTVTALWKEIDPHGGGPKGKKAQADISASEDKLGRKLTPEEIAKKLLYYVDPRRTEIVLDQIQDFSKKLKNGKPVGAVSGTPAATPVTPTPPAVVTKAAEKAVAAQEDGHAATAQAVSSVDDTLQKGVPLAKDTVSKMGDSTLEAIRTGLFEYYMYKDLDQKTVAAGLKSGVVSPGTFGAGITAGTAATGSNQAALGAMLQQAKPNADGGIVASVANGVANVSRLPPGEGWASVGKGEKITPAGGRGGGGGSVKVELQLKGDLKRFIDARVVEGTAEFEKNKRIR